MKNASPMLKPKSNCITPTIRNDFAATLFFGGLLFAIGFWRMFRGWLFGHFDGIFGDAGDAQIVIAHLEYWLAISDQRK